MIEPRDTRIPIGIDAKGNTVFWDPAAAGTPLPVLVIEEETRLPGKSDVISPAVRALQKLAADATAPEPRETSASPDLGSPGRFAILKLKYRAVEAAVGAESDLAKALREEMRAFWLGDYETVARGTRATTR